MPITEVKNRNFQIPLNFDFRVDRLPDFNYFVQKVNLPTVALTPASNTGTNPFVRVNWTGDHMRFGELEVEFKVDEEMRNWYEIFSWMQAIAFPERQAQFGALYKNQLKDLDGNIKPAPGNRMGMGVVFGQGILTVNTSKNNPHLVVNFVDIHPVSLSEVAFDSTNTDAPNITSTVNFKYDYFTVEKVK